MILRWNCSTLPGRAHSISQGRLHKLYVLQGKDLALRFVWEECVQCAIPQIINNCFGCWLGLGLWVNSPSWFVSCSEIPAMQFYWSMSVLVLVPCSSLAHSKATVISCLQHTLQHWGRILIRFPKGLLPLLVERFPAKNMQQNSQETDRGNPPTEKSWCHPISLSLCHRNTPVSLTHCSVLP